MENISKLRVPIVGDSKTLVVDPYAYRENNLVNRSHPAMIKGLAEQGRLERCYFPIEPFHYREHKRKATRNAMEECLKHDVNMSLETRRVVPDWAIEYLSRQKFSDIRIQMNTFDNAKWRKLYNSKEASSPDELLDSLIRSFNGGAYTILKIAPIVPVIISPVDVFRVVDTVKNWSEHVEVSFATFTEPELSLLKKKVPKEFEEIINNYELVGDRYVANTDYRKKFLEQLYDFTKGYKLDLKILNEIEVDSDGEAKVISF